MAANSLNYTALPYLEIGDHTAIFFLHPVVTTLFSYPVLGEAVGWKDAPTVIMGLLGMLLIVRPPAVFQPLGEAAPWLGVPPDEASGSHTTQGPRWMGVVMQLGAPLSTRLNKSLQVMRIDGALGTAPARLKELRVHACVALLRSVLSSFGCGCA